MYLINVLKRQYCYLGRCFEQAVYRVPNAGATLCSFFNPTLETGRALECRLECTFPDALKQLREQSN